MPWSAAWPLWSPAPMAWAGWTSRPAPGTREASWTTRDNRGRVSGSDATDTKGFDQVGRPHELPRVQVFPEAGHAGFAFQIPDHGRHAESRHRQRGAAPARFPHRVDRTPRQI